MHGFYLAESVGIAAAISEFLLQSVDDPSTNSGQALSTGSGQAPSTGSGQALSTGSGQAPSASSGQAPSTAPARSTIRVFPCWPKETDAAFANLRAQGGFLVSAEQRGGQVVKVDIVSTVGGSLRVLSPWTGAIIERATRAGETVSLKP